MVKEISSQNYTASGDCARATVLFTKSMCAPSAAGGADEEAAGVGEACRCWPLSAGGAAAAVVAVAACFSGASPEFTGEGGSGTGKRWTHSGGHRCKPDARYASDHEYGTKKSSGFSSSTYLNLSSGDFYARRKSKVCYSKFSC